VESSSTLDLTDVTERVQSVIYASKVSVGQVVVLSKHTTTAVILNEMETRLIDDIKDYLVRSIPPKYSYKHNDLHLRHGPPGVISNL
jgi:secondary thiamine-phosphate synthase enzyme